MSDLFEMHVVTFGSRTYAKDIVSILDPNGRYFGSRILTKEDSVDPDSKKANLKSMFPGGDELVCMIDDCAEIWEYSRNLVPVKPYIFFGGVDHVCAPHVSESPIDCEASVEDEDDGHLVQIERTLREVSSSVRLHSIYS